jgi:UDP-N-acetylglucosamine 2-epimerase (non-hydrolysing)
MAPVVVALRRSAAFEPWIVATGQHREMLEQVFTLFGITPDVSLDVMQPNQTLADLTGRLVPAVAACLSETPCELLLVQGDTTTALAASLAAFYLKVPVGHVEAGLRSGDDCNPFPEEMNRRMVSVVAELHFAPTPGAAAHLAREGVSPDRVVVSGNTVVDALSTLLPVARREQRAGALLAGVNGGRMLLVTSHRRESWGSDLESICLAIRDLVTAFPDLHVIYPVHLNPNVGATVSALLDGVERVQLAPPADYLAFLQLMDRATLILTDSGGVQEEAPSLAKPLLVLRKLTERPEACDAGAAIIVGTSRARIVAEASRLLRDGAAYRAMAAEANPFGDGRASDRIVRALTRWRQGTSPLLPAGEHFQAGVEVTC